jgi:pilus assembly protein CpaB
VAGSALLPKAPDDGVTTVVAARDLPISKTLSAEDVRVEHRPSAYVPQGALSDTSAAVGQVLAGQVLAGEPVTPTRFRAAGGLTALPAGSLAVSLPVPDTGLLTTLHPADVVSVLVTGTGETVATAAPVLAVDRPAEGMLGGSSPMGGHVVLALAPAEARAVAVAMGSVTTSGFVLALSR